MERDGTGHLSTIYTYGNQRINSESYNNLGGLYTYDGRGSVSAVIGSYGDFRASYWYDGLGNVKSQFHGYGVFGSGKKYYGYNAESYNPVTGNQNLRARQVNIRRQRFLSEDTFLGNNADILSINRYIYGNDNPLKYKDPSGMWSVSVSANIDANVVTGAGTGVGFVIGYNRREGFVIKQIVSASFSVMSAAGGTISANVGIDWTDNPIGNSSNESFGGSVSIGPAGVGPAIGGDISFDKNSGKHHPTGINVGIGLSAAVSPINFGIGDVEFHTKKSWNYVIEENLKNNNEPDISELINDYLEKNRYNNMMEQVYYDNKNKISCVGGK